MVMKYHSNPSDSDDRSKYDQRLDTAILRPVPDERGDEEFAERLREWQESHSSKPEPIREYDYDYYVPADSSAVRGIKRKLDVNDPENESPDLYTDDNGEGMPVFKYKRLRTYETYSQHGDSKNYYNDSVALALHDPELNVGRVPGATKRLQKGAYFYPIVQRTALRTKRKTAGIARYDEEPKIEELNVVVAEPSEELQANQAEKRALLDPAARVTEVAG
jgi:RNA polymerase II-associated factor 1